MSGMESLLHWSSILNCDAMTDVEMVNTGHLVGPGRHPQCHILRCLYLLKARVTYVGAPAWCCIARDKFPQCYVGQQ